MAVIINPKINLNRRGSLTRKKARAERVKTYFEVFSVSRFLLILT